MKGQVQAIRMPAVSALALLGLLVVCRPTWGQATGSYLPQPVTPYVASAHFPSGTNPWPSRTDQHDRLLLRDGVSSLSGLQQPLPPPPGPPPTAAAPLVETTRLGPPPEDYNLQFLRDATVLLEPGQWQFDYGLTYALDDNLLPDVLSGGELDAARLRRRSLLVPFAFRLGVTPSVQAFVNAPVGWGNFEYANAEFDVNSDIGGIGDVSAGANILLRSGRHGSPDVVLNLGFVAPTGNDAFAPSLSTASLGSGFWSAFADLRFIHSYDPVIVFWGAGYRHQFKRTFFDTLDVEPGREITYELGVGLAIDDRVTLSTAFFGSVITETRINGSGIPRTMLEPMRVRLALTTVNRKKRIVEPFVTLGVTDDATDAEVGVIFTLF